MNCCLLVATRAGNTSGRCGWLTLTEILVISRSWKEPPLDNEFQPCEVYFFLPDNSVVAFLAIFRTRLADTVLLAYTFPSAPGLERFSVAQITVDNQNASAPSKLNASADFAT
jgi:hypothetical protein